MLKITQLYDNTYFYDYLDWEKWRYTYRGGRPFVEKYLQKFSLKEPEEDFKSRRELTYCPAFAKTEVKNIINSVFERLPDVIRNVNSQSYMQAIDENVDGCKSSMNYFIGRHVTEELLTMKRVAIYVDMPSLQPANLLESKRLRPYLYIYRTEQIRHTEYGDDGELDELVLTDYHYDDNYAQTITYRYYERENGKVIFKECDCNDEIITEMVLDLPVIPCHILEISDSLLADIADYQIALLNIESADIGFIMKSNFPFYVEMYDAQAETYRNITKSQADKDSTTEGAKDTVKVSTDNHLQIGTTRGRRIAKGLEFPKFIAPPTDAIKISMEKQDQIKRDIKILLNQSLAALKSNRSSADSKEYDRTAEEQGLGIIGATLNAAEIQIAKIWCYYERNYNPAVNITYPTTYELKKDIDRITETKQYSELREQIPSLTYKKEITKLMTRVLLGNKLPIDKILQIEKEIENAEAIVSTDSKTLTNDVEKGIVSREFASELRGYPEGEAEKANIEHADRALRIAEAQASAANKGVTDLADNTNDSKTAKEGIRDNTNSQDISSNVRGEANGDNAD